MQFHADMLLIEAAWKAIDDEVYELAQDKIPVASSTVLREQVSVQAKLTQAEASQRNWQSPASTA